MYTPIVKSEIRIKVKSMQRLMDGVENNINFSQKKPVF